MTPEETQASDDSRAVTNTDREIWRSSDEEPFPDRIFITEGGGVGLQCGGCAIVMPIREWHTLSSGAEIAAHNRKVLHEQSLQIIRGNREAILHMEMEIARMRGALSVIMDGTLPYPGFIWQNGAIGERDYFQRIARQGLGL